MSHSNCYGGCGKGKYSTFNDFDYFNNTHESESGKGTPNLVLRECRNQRFQFCVQEPGDAESRTVGHALLLEIVEIDKHIPEIILTYCFRRAAAGGFEGVAG